MEEEIRAEFKKNGFILVEEEEILKKCLTFCIEYKLSPSDLVLSWELYSLNRQLELTVQDDHMDAFLMQLQSEQKEAIMKREPGLHLYSNDVAMILSDEHEDAKEGILGTPTVRAHTLYPDPFDSSYKTNTNSFSSGKPLESVTPFGLRKNKFVVLSTVNSLPSIDNKENYQNNENSEDQIIRRVQPSTRCSLMIHGSQPELGCRFMHDRIEDKFNFLENRIGKHARALVASGLNEEQPTDPTVASQRNVIAVGMICCEEEGHLKEKPILLQTSVEHSRGQRVRLDLQNLSQFSIFPGQVVVIEGHNPSGHCLIASKIIDYIPLPISANENFHPAKKQAVVREFQSPDPHTSRELSMIIAAGPFTTTDNLLFEPLSELLAYAHRKQPELLILLGPFIDSEHPEIRKGTVRRSFDEIFQFEILRRLQDYAEYMGSAARVILVPSIRDANHDFVFPQPAFEIQTHDLRQQIISLTNPGMFSANEVTIGCCTIDILKQLSGDEISRNASGGSKHRLSRLAKHILSQHSFYPIYPPIEGTPLDFSVAPEALQMPIIPDILILPSDLANFVRVISLEGRSAGEEEVKCICVNPGRLARGEGGGFFAELNYHRDPDSTRASVISI